MSQPGFGSSKPKLLFVGVSRLRRDGNSDFFHFNALIKENAIDNDGSRIEFIDIRRGICLRQIHEPHWLPYPLRDYQRTKRKSPGSTKRRGYQKRHKVASRRMIRNRVQS
ncbi:hypothetical protein [Undibacterium terreum]|uniref:hypothetical protein n=1 Tax=Undibacterium terreum TaxID=1224302 RepID=UPI00166A7F3E|nr:hypothetical protein [Undibacterium terreum]